MQNPIRLELRDPYTLAGETGLIAVLQTHRHRDVQLSLHSLRRFDTALLQLLLLAAQDWQLRGQMLRLTDLSEAQMALLDLLGIEAELLPRQTAFATDMAAQPAPAAKPRAFSDA